MSYPNAQNLPAGAIPAYLVLDGAAVGTGNPLPTDSSGGGGVSVQFVTQTYRVVTAATGIAVGDLLDQIDQFDTSVTPAVWMATIWRNMTQETTLAGAPPAANIVPLAATSPGVVVTSSALPAGAATSALQPALVAGRVPVDPSGVTSPVSAASLPLPAGAATEATLAAASAKLPASLGIKTAAGSLSVALASDGALPLPAGAATAALQPALNGDGGALAHVTNFPATQAISAAALPLPTGAATSANQPALVSGRLPVDPSGVTSPVSLATAPALVASSAVIGKVGIDQTTPGTTNGVQINAAIPAGANSIGTVVLGAGAAIAGKIGIDQTTPGTTNLVQVGGSLPAGTAVIGGVTSQTSAVTVAPTVTASAYTAGNCVGGLLTFANAFGALLSGVVQSFQVTSKTVQTTGLKLYLFTANPTNSTFTDKTAPSVNAADVGKVAGVYTLGAADSGLGTQTVWNLDGIGKSMVAGATSLYGVLVCVATPTWGSTSDVTVTASVLKDG